MTEKRCDRCGWPLAESRAEGCVEGDCSYRCSCYRTRAPGQHERACPLWRNTSPFVTVDDLVVERNGKRCVEVARCVHCKRITIGPKGMCSCGAEHYPVAIMVELGEAWDVVGWLPAVVGSDA